MFTAALTWHGVGGNFVSGAKTAAFAELFNDCAHDAANDSSPKITKDDLTNKTPDEVRKMAEEKGLKVFGDKDNPAYPYHRKWKDPVTNKERLRLDSGHTDEEGNPIDHPTASQEHVHGYEPNGETPVRGLDGDRHFPLANEESIGLGSSAISVLSRVSVGVGLLLWSENAY